MNAIVSANTLDWRASSAFDPALNMGEVDPGRVYQFIGRSTFDNAFRRRLTEDASAVFDECGFHDIGRAEVLGDLDAKLALEIHERGALDELSRIVHKRGLDALVETEKGALQAGYGMPAIAALVLVVAVAVAVFVVVLAVDQQTY